MRVPRNPNPDADADGARGTSNRRPEPQCAAGRAQVEPVERLVDAQRRCQPPRTSGQIPEIGNAAVALHLRDSLKRLKSAYQDTRPYAGSFARHIEEPAGSVSESDIRRTAGEKKRIIGGRATRVRVTRGVANRIGLRFDD